jgi:hypothetical protein
VDNAVLLSKQVARASSLYREVMFSRRCTLAQKPAIISTSWTYFMLTGCQDATSRCASSWNAAASSCGHGVSQFASGRVVRLPVVILPDGAKLFVGCLVVFWCKLLRLKDEIYLWAAVRVAVLFSCGPSGQAAA